MSHLTSLMTWPRLRQATSVREAFKKRESQETSQHELTIGYQRSSRRLNHASAWRSALLLRKSGATTPPQSTNLYERQDQSASRGCRTFPGTFPANGLSRRRSRVRVPSLPFHVSLQTRGFTSVGALGAGLARAPQVPQTSGRAKTLARPSVLCCGLLLG